MVFETKESMNSACVTNLLNLFVSTIIQLLFKTLSVSILKVEKSQKLRFIEQIIPTSHASDALSHFHVK